MRWEWDGTLVRMHHALYVQCREQAGRETSPTAAIIDSQSVKSAEKGGVDWEDAGEENYATNELNWSTNSSTGGELWSLFPLWCRHPVLARGIGPEPGNLAVAGVGVGAWGLTGSAPTRRTPRHTG